MLATRKKSWISLVCGVRGEVVDFGFRSRVRNRHPYRTAALAPAACWPLNTTTTLAPRFLLPLPPLPPRVLHAEPPVAASVSGLSRSCAGEMGQPVCASPPCRSRTRTLRRPAILPR